MPKTILITGATDGIGLETARALIAAGHRVLLHGRNPDKLERVATELGGDVETYRADLSRLAEVDDLAAAISAKHARLDVLVNNAGIYRTRETESPDGLDVRFAVNTIAPYRLTRRLLPLLDDQSRVVNLSSAAQAPVDLTALAGPPQLGEGQAYAQSKLALTAWSFQLAEKLGSDGPAIIAVNPGSLLASKMVKETFGIEGSDLQIGADILVRASLSDAFAEASGRYFDNDSRRFAPPLPDATDPHRRGEIVRTIEDVLGRILT